MADDETKLSEHDDAPTMVSGGSAWARLSNSDAPTMLSFGEPKSTSGSSSRPLPAGDAPTLTNGEVFGPYTIARQLGRGGMGEVYEARHGETGRVVALKVLRGRLNQREDRARFLREGQLAASISHPHTVYIFGSEEIDGLPVISMQLVTGGTLRDRVVDRGPLPVAEAVDAVLDIISGLDAAESAGILHRDIKPSNCFVDRDGRVKVGDFGLSISVDVREGQGTGFQGTPQYAPPEQLRGEELDVRADIYAVGATLFYLLTGKAAFEAANFGELLEKVKTEAPRSPQLLQPKLPTALAAIVLRCLAKDRNARPASYTELARALRPFAGQSVPARRGLRLMAGVIDAGVISAPLWLFRQTGGYRAQRGNLSASIDADYWAVIVGVLYFALCEWRWGVTLGKRLCGLRVVSEAGELSWRQSLTRALIYYGPVIPVTLLAAFVSEKALADFLVSHGAVLAVVSTGPMLLTALLFATMRRSNGWAAVQDMVSHSRVVQTRHDELRRAAPVASPATGASNSDSHARYGSFEVGRELGKVPGGRLLDGLDIVLRRRVWVVEVAIGTPEVSTSRREVDRVGRLHWLAGVRSATENWDAFEAPQGAPVDPTPAGAPWGAARGWLNDLATELLACERDGSQPELSMDRVWIRADGRAVLLDFPAPGSLAHETRLMTPLELLTSVGRLAFGHQMGTPMPVSAVAMLDRWSTKTRVSLAEAQADLASVSQSPTQIARGRRLVPMLASAGPLILMMIAAVITVSQSGASLSSESLQMVALLDERRDSKDPVVQRDIDTYLAGTMPVRLDSDSSWKLFTKNDKDEATELRRLAREAAKLHPTAEETAAAAAAIAPLIKKSSAGGQWWGRDSDNSLSLVIVLLLTGAGMAFFPGLLSVLIRPSGLIMSALGLAVLTKAGRETSRIRAVWRLLVAWAPALVYAALLALPATRDAMQSSMPIMATVAIQALGLVWALWRPLHGPHDIVAGTRIGVR